MLTLLVSLCSPPSISNLQGSPSELQQKRVWDKVEPSFPSLQSLSWTFLRSAFIKHIIFGLFVTLHVSTVALDWWQRNLGWAGDIFRFKMSMVPHTMPCPFQTPQTPYIWNWSLSFLSNLFFILNFLSWSSVTFT